ncbi:MAG: hypothetical protein IKA16_00475 [Oscillospiraceae bacterium]|nr:hypothetical protein [Oscillospiraceae bacterium]
MKYVKYIAFPLFLFIAFNLLDLFTEPQIEWGFNFLKTVLITFIVYYFAFQKKKDVSE